MERLLLIKIICSIIIMIALNTGFNYSIDLKTDNSSDQLAFHRSLIITEVLPSQVEKESPWIELFNPHFQKVNASGLKIVINGNHKLAYKIPDKLLPVPPGNFIIILLDGEGEDKNSYNFEKGFTVLHAPGKLMDPKQAAKYGQVGLYEKSSYADDKLIGFIAWGLPNSKESISPEYHRIWEENWFVPTIPNFGIYDPDWELKPGYSIGLYPGIQTTDPDDWGVYSEKETTYGQENTVPRPKTFTLTNGAVVSDQDIAVGWVGYKYARSYQLQLASEDQFNQIIEDKLLSTSLYKPEKVLPPGDYYYRVKVIDINGRESAWSNSMKVVSQKIGQIKEEKILVMCHKFQRKDTKLLCLDGCASEEDHTTQKQWDRPHPDDAHEKGDHGDSNCVRASISMIVSFYGKRLSQDRISFYNVKTRRATSRENSRPEGELTHSSTMGYGYITPTLEWALREKTRVIKDPPEFEQLRQWLDDERPIMTAKDGHLRAMNGYSVDSNGGQCVQILDPKSGPRWESYLTWRHRDGGALETWVGPKKAPHAREDEPEIWSDSDGDGIIDFDEKFRFHTDPHDRDSDHDGVPDKNDIREYVFNAANKYCKRDADFDRDGIRKECDPDNDNDTFSDGCEDKNGNGKYEHGYGETSNFEVNQGLTCTGSPVVKIEDQQQGNKKPPENKK
jgi:hypothetical protein